MFGHRYQEIEKTVTEAVERIVKDAMGDAQSALRLSGDLTKLRQELETLKIEKARKDEDGARREREIEHKVGLERKRQEFEIEQAKRETSVTVREENLKADRTRFEEQLKFHERSLRRRSGLPQGHGAAGDRAAAVGGNQDRSEGLMGLGNLWGGLGLWQSQGFLQQQLQAQQGWLQQTANGSMSNTNTYVVSTYPVEAIPLKPAGPETALEWLDRRINEVRLPLAA